MEGKYNNRQDLSRSWTLRPSAATAWGRKSSNTQHYLEDRGIWSREKHSWYDFWQSNESKYVNFSKKPPLPLLCRGRNNELRSSWISAELIKCNRRQVLWQVLIIPSKIGWKIVKNPTLLMQKYSKKPKSCQCLLFTVSSIVTPLESTT